MSRLRLLMLSSILAVFLLVIGERQPAAAQSCVPSACAPTKVVVTRGLKQNSSSDLQGCIAYIDAFEDNILGGNVRTVSLIQPLRDIPVIGSLINKIPIVKAEKWAAAVNKTVNGEQSWWDVAWMIFVDVTVQELGAKLDKGIFTIWGQRVTQAEAVNHWAIGPILKQIAEKLPNKAKDWVTFYRTGQSWSYADLQHCVDTGKWICRPNYAAFLQEYPETFRYLDKAEVLLCGPTDNYAFVIDVNFVDGAVWPATKPFRKIWRIKNTGESAWGTGYELVFVHGARLTDGDAVAMPSRVAPGQTVDISVDMTAPATAGVYQSYWRMKNAFGAFFGPEIWVKIIVPEQQSPVTPTPVPPPKTDTKDITLVQVDYPIVVIPGQHFRPKVTMKVNQGELLEQRGDMLRGTDDKLLFGAWPHVAVVDAVTVGQTYTFEFYADNPMIAPDQAGVYESKWRVWRAGAWAGPEVVLRFEVRRTAAPPTPTTAPFVFFYADQTQLNAGECTTLHWDAERVRELYLESDGVTGHASRQVCPTETRTYQLHVILLDGSPEKHTVTIQVNSPGQGPPPPGVICGQFIRVHQSIDQWPAFQPYGANEIWIIAPEEMFYLEDIFQEGIFVRFEEPEFGEDFQPAWGYARVRALIDDNGAEVVANCGSSSNVATPVPPGQINDLAQLEAMLLMRLKEAPISTGYPQQAEQFVHALFAHLGEFRLDNLGVTTQTMVQALNHSDAGMRVNALTQGVWATWQARAQAGGFHAMTTDPGAFSDITPFRQLVITMIQNRQGRLTNAQQHALHNYFTRPEDADAWRDNMNGIIGAINRESFPGQPAPATPTAPAPLPIAPIMLAMIDIPAGNFTMGSSEADIQATVAECNATEGNCQADWFAGEMPARTVFVNAFQISQYEITNAQYNGCVNAGVCQAAGRNISDSSLPYKREYFADNFPVVGVGWQDAATFCAWSGGRLPSEEEWEKAARGANDQRRYPWGNEFDPARANLGSGYPAAVGSYPSGASPYGVMDMAGNVFEWTATQVDGKYVVRGGGWSKFHFRGRVTDRGTKLAPGFANYDIGFRCVK